MIGRPSRPFFGGSGLPGVTATIAVFGSVLLQKAKENGVTAEEMAELLTHAAFYAGWPKAWAALRFAEEIYKE